MKKINFFAFPLYARIATRLAIILHVQWSQFFAAFFVLLIDIVWSIEWKQTRKDTENSFLMSLSLNFFLKITSFFLSKNNFAPEAHLSQ